MNPLFLYVQTVNPLFLYVQTVNAQLPDSDITENKVEEKFRTGNARESWSGLRVMMGKKQTKPWSTRHSLPHSANSVDTANELNSFYAGFDVRDFSEDCATLCETIVPEQLDLSEADVVTSFSRLNSHKASGPDGLKGRTLKNCATQLGKVFTLIFQLFWDSHVMPRSWKTSTIIPVPKKATPLQLNDYHPVALTPIIAKCFEKVVSKHLKFDVHQLDPFQFAYKASRGVEDVSLTLLNLITQHLEKARSYVRILFVDFSSAFNTIEPYVLLKRLMDLHVNSNLALWIRDFLRDRPQRVCVNGYLSEEVVLNSRAPQGCVLSPILFSIYTTTNNNNVHLSCVHQRPERSHDTY